VAQTHDTAEDGFHEIQLSGKQLVFLFMATTVLSVMIFLCGVLVGRNARAAGAAAVPEETVVVTAPTDGAPVDGTTAAPQEPTAVPNSALTYHEQLRQAKPKEELKPQEVKPEPPPPAPAPAVAAAPDAEADVPTSGRPGAWVIQVHALSNRSAASSVVRGLIAKGYPAFLSLPQKNQPVIYRVQIGRYTDRREAEQVVRRLQKEEQFQPEIKR
jgi:cell division septation protein DedD